MIGVIGGSVPFILFFNGLAMASAPSAAFIHKTLFVWVVLLAVPFLGERLGWFRSRRSASCSPASSLPLLRPASFGAPGKR